MTFPLLGIGGAFALGIALGLLGSGGSIVTVPVLVYLFGQPEKLAIAGSLGVVGVVASAGAIMHARAGMIATRVALVFAPAGMLGSWLGAIASRYVTGTTQLQAFAIAMLGAAALMAFPQLTVARQLPQPAPSAGSASGPADILRRLPQLGLMGLAVGMLTGFVGVGGGFLIVPALVIGARLEMHRAVGTSLAVIALSALAGFATHVAMLARSGAGLDYLTLGIVAALGIAGSLIGQRFGAQLPSGLLRRLFGVVLVALAIFILTHGAAQSPAGK